MLGCQEETPAYVSKHLDRVLAAAPTATAAETAARHHNNQFYEGATLATRLLPRPDRCMPLNCLGAWKTASHPGSLKQANRGPTRCRWPALKGNRFCFLATCKRKSALCEDNVNPFGVTYRRDWKQHQAIRHHSWPIPFCSAWELFR